MKVLSLFDGISCARMALNAIGANVTTYIASEIDRHAIANTMHNFPDTIQVGSVTDINVPELVEKYGVPDFLCGGSPCFAEHTKVLTADGYKNIEDIQVGDMVLTHRNRYRKVLAVGHKEAMTYALYVDGFDKTVCTSNHPFYTWNGIEKEPKWRAVRNVLYKNLYVGRHNDGRELMTGQKSEFGIIWTKAESLRKCKRQTVYNMEVEEDNSYTANNMIVHNCQSFSFSGKMKGMSTAQGEEIHTLDRYLELKAQGFEFEGQSYLFWEYMRILTELRKYNPDIYFFLENVEMLDKWERCLSHAIGVRGVHINSALVSAQQRKRIYWSNIRVKDLGITSLFDELNDDPFELPRYQTDIPQPEDRGIVIKDILQETADGKYYLKDDVVAKLIEKTDKGKLKDYILEPQVGIQEALDYMASDKEYSSLSEEERQELATLGYTLEKQRLHDNYYGKERSFLD